VTCTITTDVLLYTGDTVFVTPTSPSSANVISCISASPSTIVATGPNSMLPVLTASGIAYSLGPVQASFLDSKNHANVVVPANTCAFTAIGQTPPAIPSRTVLGTETVSLAPGTAASATEMLMRTNDYENVGIPFGFGQLTTIAPANGPAGVPIDITTDVYLGTSGSLVHFTFHGA
jgi:hypothetical protein